MVNVAERLRGLLRDLLTEYKCDRRICFRLIVPSEGGVALMLDVARDGDFMVEKGDSPVLLIEREVAYALSPGTVDIEETGLGPMLTVRSSLARSD